jgi:hypothetical protein
LPLREPPTPKRSKYIFGNAVILLVVILLIVGFIRILIWFGRDLAEVFR